MYHNPCSSGLLASKTQNSYLKDNSDFTGIIRLAFALLRQASEFCLSLMDWPGLSGFLRFSEGKSRFAPEGKQTAFSQVFSLAKKAV
jgi:hypothetical protein